MALLRGYVNWNLNRDIDGHRTYKIAHVVQSTSSEGPNSILNVAGLPITGSTWLFGGDSDPWAFCYPTKKVDPWRFREGKDITTAWKVESTFSTKPINRCQDTDVEDPLLEPEKVSGSFVKYTKEATTDRFGAAVKSSSHEIFRGPQVEIDDSRADVHITQNVASLNLAVIAGTINNVNSGPMWGLATDTVKFSTFSWTRNYFGTCDVYYTRTLDFDIDFNTFKRNIWDEGTKVLNGEFNKTTGVWDLIDIGGGAPDPNDPTHFIRVQDIPGNITRMLLNGAGEPITDGSSPVVLTKEFYPQADLLALDIPTVL